MLLLPPARVLPDNQMHNLHTERFLKPRMVNGRYAAAGPIKTFPLRGIKDLPPYLYDDRLTTLEDSVEFFNLELGTKLSKQKKKASCPSCASFEPAGGDKLA